MRHSTTPGEAVSSILGVVDLMVNWDRSERRSRGACDCCFRRFFLLVIFSSRCEELINPRGGPRKAILCTYIYNIYDIYIYMIYIYVYST